MVEKLWAKNHIFKEKHKSSVSERASDRDISCSAYNFSRMQNFETRMASNNRMDLKQQLWYITCYQNFAYLKSYTLNN